MSTRGRYVVSYLQNLVKVVKRMIPNSIYIFLEADKSPRLSQSIDPSKIYINHTKKTSSCNQKMIEKCIKKLAIELFYVIAILFCTYLPIRKKGVCLMYVCMYVSFYIYKCSIFSCHRCSNRILHYDYTQVPLLEHGSPGHFKSAICIFYGREDARKIHRLAARARATNA